MSGVAVKTCDEFHMLIATYDLMKAMRSEGIFLLSVFKCRTASFISFSVPCREIPHLRPVEYKRSRLPRNRRTVNRPYGGVLSVGAVRERIIRAFLVEEQKIVKKVLKIQKTKEKQAART